MAKITRFSTAPEGDLTFSIGQVDFVLTADKAEYNTTNSDVIAYAEQSRYLAVEETPADVAAFTPDPGDQSDPHINSKVDVLSNDYDPTVAKAITEDAGYTFVAPADNTPSLEQPQKTVAQILAESQGDVTTEVPAAVTETAVDVAPAAETTSPAAAAPSASAFTPTSTGAGS